MTRSTFADELQQASDRIADIPRADLQIMLRRAALIIRNTDGINLDPGIGETLSGVAVEMGLAKSDLIKTIIGDWLIANAYLPVPRLFDEESETEGSA
ncbi:hypothetical protein EOB49_32560 [Mesorhizobium sp. M7A.F.Ca.MR.148.00.0.0]|nr:hypothetical protein EOB49_32560 [Mesorhizobium sp. M7A.F.Ca.MR.148.00.0.0]